MNSLFKNDNGESTISSDDYNKDMSLNKLNLKKILTSYVSAKNFRSVDQISIICVRAN